MAHLDRHLLSTGKAAPMHLPDGGAGGGSAIQPGEEKLAPIPEIGTNNRCHGLEGRRRRPGAKDAQERARLGGQGIVHIAQDLADLHGDPLELAEGSDQFLDRGGVEVIPRKKRRATPEERSRGPAQPAEGRGRHRARSRRQLGD